MIKNFFSSSLLISTGVYATTNVINAAIPFFLLPVLTRYLTPEDYGIVAMFAVMLGIVGTFTGLSVHAAIGRQYFERNTVNFPKYITNCLYILFTSSAFVWFLLWFFSDWISQFTKFPANWFWAVLTTSVGQFIILVVLTLWQVEFKSIFYSLFQILFTLTNFGLSIWFIVGLNMNWQGRIEGQVIATIGFALLGFIILWKSGWLKFGYSGRYVRHALNYGIPLIPHTVGGILISMTDKILITKMIGVADTGIYVVGAQVGMIIGMIESSFNQAWMPWLFNELKKNDIVVKLRVVKITYFYGFFILVTAILLSMAAPWFLSFFVGRNFADATQYVIWIALGYAFSGMYKMAANYIFYAETTHILAWITFFTACTNILISYFLIRLNGAIGAAQGTMCTFLISFILTWILSARLYKMPWGLKIS